jgi:hypothetical protein
MVTYRPSACRVQMRNALLSLIKEQPSALNLALHEPPPFVGHLPSEYVLFCQTCLFKLVQRKVYSPPPRTEIPSTTTDTLHYNPTTRKRFWNSDRLACSFLTSKVTCTYFKFYVVH